MQDLSIYASSVLHQLHF